MYCCTPLPVSWMKPSCVLHFCFFFFSSRRRHTRSLRDWSSDVCSSDLSGVFNTPGESCWTFGNVGYPNVPCDHFGVSTIGSPTRTTYSWLVESATPGEIGRASCRERV